MKRIDTATRLVNAYGTGRDGFTEGTPGVTPPTALSAEFFGHVQEEIARAIELLGGTLSASSKEQLATEILAQLSRRAHDGALNGLWQPTISGTSPSVRSVTSNGSGLLVAVGLENAAGDAWYSNGGVEWTLAGMASTPSALNEVAFGAGLYVAVGEAAQIRTSTDGATWTSRTPAGGFAGAFKGVIWDGTRFLAVGDTGEVQHSTDGINWTRANVSTTRHFRTIAFSGSNYVIISEDLAAGHYAYRTTTPTNAASWSTSTVNAGTDNYSRVRAFRGAFYVAVGNTGGGSSTIYKSADNGATWTNITTGTPLSNLVNALAVDGDKALVAAGDGGRIWSTFDGTTWIQRAGITTGAFVNASFAERLWFFAEATAGCVLTRPCALF